MGQPLKLPFYNDLKNCPVAKFPIMRGADIQQHIVEGEYVATVFHLRTPTGVTTVFDKFRGVDGKRKESNPYYDPGVLNAAVTAYLAPPSSSV